MRFDIITIFPKIFDSYLQESLLKRAQEKKIVQISVHNLRDWSNDKHLKIDDRPFGGGPGMVLKIEPIYRAVSSILRIFNFPASAKATAGRQFSISKHKGARIILFSTRGKKLDSKIAKRLALCDQLILICGRYEGVDERVAEYIADEEISIGDYVLSGGELPALVLVEAVSRHLPGFLGKYESLEEIKGSYPVYTRPEIFYPGDKRQVTSKKKAWRAPKILVSGDHKQIDDWRKENAGR